MLPLFEAVRLSWVRGDDDAVLLAGAGILGGVAVAVASLCAGLSTDCSTRWSLMGSWSAAARPWKLLCVMEVRGERSSRDCAEGAGAGLQAPACACAGSKSGSRVRLVVRRRQQTTQHA